MTQFLEAVKLSMQDPFGGPISLAEDLGRLYRTEPFIFSSTAHGDENLRPSFTQALFRREPYSAQELLEYESLSDTAKIEVLAFETVLLHELTHQIDTVATPMGAFLHGLQAEEYFRMLPILQFLATTPELDISDPFSRTVLACDQHPVREALKVQGLLASFDELMTATSQLRTLDPLGSAHIREGWSGQTGHVNLFGEDFEAVTILDEVLTLRPPGAKRPLTMRSVLEAHALANCVRHILWRFEKAPRIGALELRRYIEYLYPPEESEDYLVLLNSVSTVWGYPDFVTALQNSTSKSLAFLDQIPTLTGLLAWTALHGADPTERLIYACAHFSHALSAGLRFNSSADFLKYMETHPALGQTESALSTGLHLVETQRERVQKIPEVLADHFTHMLTGVSAELNLRLERGLGLADPVGAPNSGNFAPYLTASQLTRYGNRYQPGESFRQWRVLRDDLMTRFSSKKHARIRTWLAKDWMR